jgi:hypothetical protein
MVEALKVLTAAAAGAAVMLVLEAMPRLAGRSLSSLALAPSQLVH